MRFLTSSKSIYTVQAFDCLINPSSAIFFMSAAKILHKHTKIEMLIALLNNFFFEDNYEKKVLYENVIDVSININ